MVLKTHRHFFLGEWQVSPSTNSVRCGDVVKQLEPKAMDVLLVLCQQQGEVLSADEIANQCWGDVAMGDNPVHKAINQLRKAFDDKPSEPTYIETIRKRGYRIIAQLNFPLNDELKAQQSNWQGESPFPGLSAFEPKEAQVFFGRNEQISTLLERVSKQINFGRGFCLILGPSGTGKSSLINAGLLPKLLHRNGYDGIGAVSYSGLDFADINQQRLFIDLASALLDWDIADQPVFDGLSADSLAELLQHDCDSVLKQCKQALSRAPKQFAKPHFFLFIDRLEVLLSSPLFSENERNLFLKLIETLATSGCILVFSACRNDFYPLVVSHPSLMAGKDNGAHFDLMPPKRTDLMQMIRLPAIAANLSWSQDPSSATPLDEILCAEAAQHPDSLPMLQYTLQELYLQRSEQDELLFSVYQDLGGIEGAIGKKAEEIYQQLPQEQQLQLAYVLSLLVTLNPDGETITSRAARWSQLKQVNQSAFVQAMVDSRLFVSHLQNDEACFSLAHEALLRRWSRASEWIVEHQDSLAIKSRLHILTQRWLNEGKSTAFLLAEGKPLQEALSLQHSGTFILDNHEQTLIKSSVKRAKTKRWSTGAAIVLLCILSFTSVLMSIKSQESQSVAQQKRLEAESLLGFMVGEFADKLRSVKRMDLLDGISNKALEYFSQQDEITEDASLLPFANTEQNFKARYQHAQTLSAMGEVAYSRGKNDEAQQAFVATKIILDKLYAQQPDKLELLKTLGANAFWLGQLAYDRNDYSTAQPLFELYQQYSEKMNQIAPDNIETWTELYYAYSTLGSLFLKQLKYTESYDAFTSSLTIIERTIAKQPQDPVLRLDKSDTLSWLATTEQALGHLSLALKLHQEAQQEIELGLQYDPDNAASLEILAYSHWHQARLLNYLGKYDNAYNKAVLSTETLKTILQQDSENQDWKNALLKIEIFKIKILIGKDSVDNGVSPTLVEQYTTEIFNETSIGLMNFAYLIEYYQSNNAWNKSSELIDKTSRYLSNYSSINKMDAEYQLGLAELTLLKAKQFAKNNQVEQSSQVCEEAIKLLSPLVKVSRNVEYLLPYARAHSCLNKLEFIPEEIAALLSMQVTNFNFTH
ncbi:nSTAND1 domain-containing NTPase [Paraglaciecola hydrolytica]|uniref:Transcriptional regulator n=1 Tax=Paraglaciecola hydrolytica TaxID=1799789 RepID=A0A136A4M8_9ALTE|nr:winged helix-turn-helix domain-containing protein [Paraglaciecola hydrolytica]KXI30195.1 transcriptional regulator [Paraglaciecola hydrolytica]